MIPRGVLWHISFSTENPYRYQINKSFDDPIQFLGEHLFPHLPNLNWAHTMFQALFQVPTVNKAHIIPAFLKFTMEMLKNIYSGKTTMLLNLLILQGFSICNRVHYPHFIPKLTHSYILKAAIIKVLSNK